MVKLQMKISGGFRTVARADRFAQVQDLLETPRKQGRELLDVLKPDLVLP